MRKIVIQRVILLSDEVDFTTKDNITKVKKGHFITMKNSTYQEENNPKH